MVTSLPRIRLQGRSAHCCLSSDAAHWLQCHRPSIPAPSLPQPSTSEVIRSSYQFPGSPVPIGIFSGHQDFSPGAAEADGIERGVISPALAPLYSQLDSDDMFSSRTFSEVSPLARKATMCQWCNKRGHLKDYTKYKVSLIS